jgi:DNA-binding beta-propeller fold protein YncE
MPTKFDKRLFWLQIYLVIVSFTGISLGSVSVATGGQPMNIAVNPLTNNIYIANFARGKQTRIQGPSTALRFARDER